MQANGCGAWETFFASFPHVLPPHLPPSVLSGCKGGEEGPLKPGLPQGPKHGGQVWGWNPGKGETLMTLVNC